MNLPLFDKPKQIKDNFDPQADIVLYQGDVENFVATIPDNSVSLIITSPPYNPGKEYEDRVSIGKYLELQAQVITELYRVLRDDGSICWQVGNFVQDGQVYPLDILYYDIFKNLGLRPRNRIVWRFGHGLHCKNRFSGRYETILWFTEHDSYRSEPDAVHHS